ncbi:TPA: hypothetical protein ACIJTY_000356 [Klebsiella oxytoca]
MTERGMIFNGEMVRAILNGRKTQTRRIVNWHGLNEGLNLKFSGLKAREYPNGWVIESDNRSSSEWRCKPTLCPFGSVGDRIWVRETFSCIGNEDGHPVDAKGNLCSREEAQRIYRASAIQKPNNYGLWSSPDGFDFEGAWTPSIHMPRWASRILLEITNVRVERLNSIHDVDAMREGIQNLTTCSHADFGIPGVVNAQHPVRAFQLLWESIYGADNWKANPWVWVIEFKRVEGGAA